MTRPFPPAYYYAGYLRRHGYDIPVHIPNYARICEADVVVNEIRRPSLYRGTVCSVMGVPSFPPEKFQWYRPKQVCTRVLKSRNKREGGYLGWRVLTAAKRFSDWQGRNKPGHQRLGSEIMIDTLRKAPRNNFPSRSGTTRVFFDNKSIGTATAYEFK